MACTLEEHAQLKRELETAKNQLARIGLVHDRLGQKSDELVMRYQKQQQRSAKRKRARSLSSESPSSSRSSSCSPRRPLSLDVDQVKAKLTPVNAELDVSNKQLQTKLTAMEDERNAAQAEVKIERDRRQHSDKKRNDIKKMMTYLLHEFGADQKLLLSFAESCKNEDITEIEQCEHGRGLRDEAIRRRSEWQKMKAALDEHRAAFEALQKETEKERSKLLSQLSAMKQESDERQAAVQAQTDFRESTDKLREVLDLTRLTREGGPPAPNNFKNLSAELDKVGLSASVKPLTKSITNALHVIEKNAIHVVTEQANKAYHKLQARLTATEISVEAEKKRAADVQSALDATVRQKDEALQSVNTMKEAVEAAKLQQAKCDKILDAMRSSAKSALRRVTDGSSSETALRSIALLSVERNFQTNETVVCAAFETIANVCVQKIAELASVSNQLSNLRKHNVKLLEQNNAKDAEVEKFRSQIITSQKELNAVQQTYLDCQKSLEESRRDLKVAQQALQSSTEDWRLKAEDSRVAHQDLLDRNKRTIEQMKSELSKTKDSLERAAHDASAQLDELRSELQKVESALALATKAKNKWFRLTLYFQEKAAQANELECDVLSKLRTRVVCENGSSS